MNLRINSCGVSDCPPSWRWITSKNGFPDYDLWVVFRGSGRIGHGEKPAEVIPVQEGAALILTPDTPFAAEHDKDRPLYTIHAHFDYLDDAGNVMHPHGLLARSIADTTLMRSLLMRMVMFFHSNKKKEAAVFLHAALTEFFQCRELAEVGEDHHWEHIIGEICTELDAGGPLPTLGDYAKRYAYSERYIGKMFQTLRGISFSDYTRNARINKAKALLLHTNATVTEIAAETGFYDACHFTKTFRAAVGISPAAFRRGQKER